MNKNFFEPILQNFDARRLFCYKRLSEMGFDVVKPRGTFYITLRIANLDLSSKKFSKKVIQEKTVAVIPNSIFGSYAVDRFLSKEELINYI